jgi:plastocyanin
MAISLAFAGLTLAACGYGGSMNAGSHAVPAVKSALLITATLPKDTIGEELPSAGLGTIDSSKWLAVLGGFTQTNYSQALGFPPGTKVTITNLSASTDHTLNVVEKISGPPAKFPPSPNLPLSPQGNGKLGTGYASGVIAPHKSVTVTLVRGIYLIGCAIHYSEGMRDVIVVRRHAKPGPQATPPA